MAKIVRNRTIQGGHHRKFILPSEKRENSGLCIYIHLIWELLEMNGKEKPNVSFMKFTSHQFLKVLRKTPSGLTNHFKVSSEIRSHQFWHDKSLHTELYSRSVLEQKLDYLHYNPAAGKWKLVKDYMDYVYSSCRFYELEDDSYEFLTHYMGRM